MANLRIRQSRTDGHRGQKFMPEWLTPSSVWPHFFLFARLMLMRPETWQWSRPLQQLSSVCHCPPGLPASLCGENDHFSFRWRRGEKCQRNVDELVWGFGLCEDYPCCKLKILFSAFLYCLFWVYFLFGKHSSHTKLFLRAFPAQLSLYQHSGPILILNLGFISVWYQRRFFSTFRQYSIRRYSNFRQCTITFSTVTSLTSRQSTRLNDRSRFSVLHSSCTSRSHTWYVDSRWTVSSRGHCWQIVCSNFPDKSQEITCKCLRFQVDFVR